MYYARTITCLIFQPWKIGRKVRFKQFISRIGNERWLVKSLVTLEW